MSSFKNKKVAILGWGINGLDVLNYLFKQGADISIFDQKEREFLDFSDVNTREVKLFLGKNYLKGGLKDYEYIFRTPAVYRYLPEIVEAEKMGVVVTSSVKLFFELCPAKIVGVTGTKGKGTTSTLIYEILKNDGKDVYLAGNIGKPVLQLLPKLNRRSWVVLELSSFQLIDMTKSPQIAVVLNITEDHLDWHKNRKEYIEAKRQIVRYQGKEDFAVINYDYKVPKSFEKITKASVYYFSKRKRVRGAYVENGEIFLSLGGRKIKLGKTKDLLLRGKHNWENICAAACASYLAGADSESIKKTIFSFKGLEHRLELVREIGGLKFYNDSFSTNPQTTMAAIDSFEEPITLILGGYDKDLDYSKLVKQIVNSNVSGIILIGNISQKLKKLLKNSNYKGKMVELGYSKMPKIVKESVKLSEAGGVILLSPAAASFDMFKDYKDRGTQFKKAVLNLNFEKLSENKVKFF